MGLEIRKERGFLMCSFWGGFLFVSSVLFICLLLVVWCFLNVLDFCLFGCFFLMFELVVKNLGQLEINNVK